MLLLIRELLLTMSPMITLPLPSSGRRKGKAGKGGRKESSSKRQAAEATCNSMGNTITLGITIAIIISSSSSINNSNSNSTNNNNNNNNNIIIIRGNIGSSQKPLSQIQKHLHAVKQL
jgi:hypothetical protein